MIQEAAACDGFMLWRNLPHQRGRHKLECDLSTAWRSEGLLHSVDSMCLNTDAQNGPGLGKLLAECSNGKVEAIHGHKHFH